MVLRAIGHFGCGLLGDVVYRCLDDPIKTRKLATTIPFDLSDVAVLNITLTGSLTATVGLIVASLLLLTGSCQSNWAIQREIQPLRRQRGVGDFIYFLSNLSWIVGPALTGRPPDSVLPRLLQRAYVWRSDRFAGVLAMLLSIRSRSAVTIPVAAQPSN
ncbi:hypothetical protein [Paraburkholderia elongata]|uniref:Uncharacterized protein n=1 Tax=Paraburkholderia elongata TaxID=2675747 RepID=A0A972NWI5_9BURK|nr:hypothetical protein [Paraburkholderia elongata]NPT61041.1 hypothetical protein [Paraburkholderia elongata]